MASETPEPPDLNEGDPSSKSVAPVCKENLDCGGQDALEAPVVAQVTTSVELNADVQDDSLMKTAVFGDIPGSSEIVVDTTADDSPQDDVGIRHPGPVGIPQVDGGLMGGPVGGSFMAENVEEMIMRNTGKQLMTEKMPSSSSNPAAQVPKPQLSQGEFGKILQISQWSLTHRIQVCEILQDSGQHWRMSIRSRHEYARQSHQMVAHVQTSLSGPPVWEPPDPLDGFDPENWESNLEKLEVEMEKFCFQSWAQLTKELESELETLRKRDEKEGWYAACREKAFQAQKIFQAVEGGNLMSFKAMMEEIGMEYWILHPREYGGATPLHWAALHGQEDMVSFMLEGMQNSTASTDVAGMLEFVHAHDDFGFTPLHMALFPTLWSTYRYPEDKLKKIIAVRDELAMRCSHMMDSLFKRGATLTFFLGKTFRIVTADTRDDSRAYFVASSYYDMTCSEGKAGDRINPLALAVLIAHSSLIEKFVHNLEKIAFEPITGSENNVLHLVASGGSAAFFELGRVMTILLRLSERYCDAPKFVNFQDRAKRTPLHIAIAKGNRECVAALLKNKSIEENMNDIADENGHTPFSLARKVRVMSTKTGVVRDMVDMYREHNRKFWDGTSIHNDMPMSNFNYKPGRFSRKDCDDIATKIFDLIFETEFQGPVLREECIKLIQILKYSNVDCSCDQGWKMILQMSQWSLTYRIHVCKLLHYPPFHKSMDPRTAKEYAEQSLSLIKMNLQSDGNTLFASILGDSLDWEDPENEKLFRQAWKELTSELKKEQDTLREKDTHENWYKAFEGKAFQPHEIFEAVELNLLPLAQWMMNQVTRSLLETDCTSITLGEYRGATPLHWAMLHGNTNMVKLMIKEANKLDAHKAVLIKQDEFGFKPIHMVILSSFMDECFPKWDLTGLGDLLNSNKSERVHPNCKEYDYIGGSFKPYLFSNNNANDIIEICYREIFGANKVLSPLELAIYIAKEKVVEDLMVGFVGFVKPSTEDTLLHFAARAFNSDDVTVMNVVLRHLHLQPDMLNSCNKDGETPLHIAIRQEEKDALVLALLRCHCIKVNIPNKNGLIPLQLVADDKTYIKNLIENHPQGRRYMQLLQLSQWSLRHRILAIQMFIENENDAILEKVKDIYMEQCRVVVGGDGSRRGDVAELTDIANKLREKLKKLPISQQVQKVYISIEEGDYPMNILSDIDQYKTRNKLDHLLHQLSEFIALDSMPSDLPEYTGVNWFHWAVLHGRADMVDSICSRLKAHIMLEEFVPSSDDDDVKKEKCAIQDKFEAQWAEFRLRWARIVDARDGFGFTPLHLVAFPFPWQSNHTYTDEDGTEKGVELVEKLHENKFHHCASRGPRLNFMLWNCSDDGGSCTIHADDTFPTSSDIYPIQLAVHTARPRIVEGLLGKCSEKAFIKTHSSEDTILHAAEAWEVMSQCSGYHWRRIETNLLKLLDSPSNSNAVNVLNNDRETPLHKAVRSMSQEWVNVLLQCEHIKFNLSNNSSGNTILHDAEAWEALSKCPGDQWRRIETNLLKLLDSPSNSNAVNVLNNDRETPLHKAVRSMSPEWVNVLLQCEHIKFNLSDSSFGNTILHDAEAWEALSKCSEDQWRRIKTILLKLLDSPSNSNAMNVLNNDRETPLHKAVRSMSPEWVNVLLECEHIKFNLSDNSSGNTILHDAEAWEALSKCPGDQWRRIETNLLKLLDSPSNSNAVNVLNNDRETPLHKAVRSMSQEWVNVLLQCEHIKFNLSDSSFGNTILHDAEAWEALSKCSEDQWRRIKTILLKLLDSPSNSNAMNILNNDRETPLHKAVRSMSPEWVNVLLECEHIKFNLSDNSSGNTILHDAEAWEALSKCSEDQWRRIKTILLKLLDIQSLDPEAVNVLNNDRETPLHKAVRSMSPEWVNVLLQCEHIKFNLSDSSSGNTILHDAEAWEALSKCSEDQWRRIKTILLKLLDSQSLDSKAVNVRNNDRDTPLHKAVRSESQEWVNVLLQCEQIKFNLRDKEACTPEEVAFQRLKKYTHNESSVSLRQNILRWTRINRASSDRKITPKIVSIIDSIRSFDPESKPKERETLQRDRQVYVDAANAILVGAALIASASFGAWLQPPLGYQAYYSSEFQDTNPAAPPGTYESYVAIKQHWILHMFWIFNSLAFFSSLATVIAGADAAIPWQETELIIAVESVRRAVKIASALLGMAIVFVICTFATLGFAVLPPIGKYQINMWCTLAVGGLLCLGVLYRLLRKLVLSGSQTTG